MAIMDKEDVLVARRGEPRTNGSAKTISLKLLDDVEGAEDEPPSPGVASGATTETTAQLRLVDEGADPVFAISPRSASFCHRYFPDATIAQWNDWKWQLRNRLKDLKTLDRVFRLSDDERRAVQELGDALPVGITPYYASLMDTE